ncbi:hypothetical protein BJ165DRAFT_127259 [Panaeolus papilionaceus]|nr:hypothetical protein BJ165DRAFT_127259 [Panaeolus papilionaceus]
MSKSETAVIIVDSSSFDFSFQGFWENTSGAFQYIGLDSAYLNTTRDSLDRLGNFTFTFEGFGVTFVGIPPRPAPSTFPISTITIDPDSPQSLGVPASNGIPISYFEPWYKTPDLPYGTHTIFMTHCYAMAVDYALVVVGPDTELDGKTIFVDDNDPQIQYHGSGWKINNTSVYDSNHDRILTTAQNTTRQTTQVGDSFSFAFLGMRTRTAHSQCASLDPKH